MPDVYKGQPYQTEKWYEEFEEIHFPDGFTLIPEEEYPQETEEGD